MNLSSCSDVEWQILLDTQLKEERRTPLLFERIKPFLFVLSVLAFVIFFVEVRSPVVLRQRVATYLATDNPIGTSKTQFKNWVATKKHTILSETSGRVTVAIQRTSVGINRYFFVPGDIVQVSANFDSEARLISFEPATKTGEAWY